MTAVPAERPLTAPAVTVAMLGLLLDHVPPEVASDNVIVPYTHIGLRPVVSEIALAVVLLTDTVAVEEQVPMVYLMVVTPVVPVDVQAPVVGLMVPTVVGVLLQVPVLTESVKDSPVVDVQIANGPPGVPPEDNEMRLGAMLYISETAVEVEESPLEVQVSLHR